MSEDSEYKNVLLRDFDNFIEDMKTAVNECMVKMAGKYTQIELEQIEIVMLFRLKEFNAITSTSKDTLSILKQSNDYLTTFPSSLSGQLSFTNKEIKH